MKAHRSCLLALGLLLFLAGIVLMLFGLALSADAAPSEGGTPPAAISTTVTLHDVVCKFGCCCAHPYAYYGGHVYDRGATGYCKWGIPAKLYNGQSITLTLYRAR